MKKKRHTNVTTDPCLLTYLPSTYPAPLPVSKSQAPLTGLLHTAAINQGTSSVYCNKVLVAVPIGSDENKLFAESPTPSVSCNTSKWTISRVEIKSGRELGLNNDVLYATSTFQCRAESDFLINYNLVFGVQGQMTQLISDCTIIIQETSGTSSDPNTFTNKRAQYTVTPATPQFYLQNFVTTAPASPTVPTTEFANSVDIQFSWESNGTFFQIYQKNATQPIYAGIHTTFKLRGGISKDTTFFLVAMMSGNPSGDDGSGGYQPIYLYDALTITISNPDLTPKSAAISGTASVGGTLGVTGQTNLGNAIVGGTLTTTGQTNLGNANVGGTLGVTGQTNVGNASVGGTLGVTGQTNLKDTIVTGNLQVSGITTIKGGLVNRFSFVQIFDSSQWLRDTGTYLAKSDGFVVGSIFAPGDPDKICIGWIAGATSEGTKTIATGGNLGFRSGQTAHNESFTLPVSRNSQFTLSAAVWGGNQVNPSFEFRWIALGYGSPMKTIEKISDEYPPIDVTALYRDPRSYEEKIKTLIDVIEATFEKQISRENKDRLLSALMDLQV